MASPRLVLATNWTELQSTDISNWEDEGFAVSCVPYRGDKKDYINQFDDIADALEPGDQYAIVGEMSSTLSSSHRFEIYPPRD